MFGIEDPWILAGYLGCILSALLCIVYGAATWNRDGEEAATANDVAWVEEEKKIDEEL